MNSKKPTSPHIQIYKWNISSITSILHRFTGIALYFSIILLSWFLVFFAYGKIDISAQESCNCPITALINNILIIIAISIAFATYYHLCNGIRHLFWDFGKGFEVKTAKINGLIVILTSLILTLLSIIAVINT
jgi:succinate dehydrogenase / fumarate reductase cytochrome b subunit